MRRLQLYSSDFFYDPTFPIKAMKRDPEINYPLHTHDFHELVVIAGGEGVHFGVNLEYRLRPGDVFIVAPGMEHGYKDCDNLVLYNVIFSSGLLDDDLFDLKRMPGFQALFYIEPTTRDQSFLPECLLQLSPAQLANILPIVDSLIEECDAIGTRIGNRTMTYSKLLLLLVTLFRCYESSTVTNPDQQKVMRLAKVFSYIESHLDSPISTDDLMEVAAMSPSTLNRYFKKTTGLSPVEYQIHKRIEYACRLMRYSDLSVMQVAEKTGFYDSNYFSRIFKKVMGASPSEYRGQKPSLR